jgi:acetolactate synthase I/II/III large subunit
MMQQCGQARETTIDPTAKKRRNRDQQRRVADVIADELVRAGVRVVFGIPGGSIAPLFDALLDHPEIRVVVTRHESHAMFAAAGYAQTTGELGVVLVTSGPGVLNTLNGLASANIDGLPVLVLVGEAPRRSFGRGAVQEGSAYGLNIVHLAAQLTKLCAEVLDANMASTLLRRAIATTMSGRRGTALLTLPLDVASSPVSRPSVALDVQTTFRVPAAVLDNVARALAAPGKKLIFAGAGARHGQAPALLRELAERLQCPVMTTPKAKGVFPESHPLSLGIFGMGGNPSSREYLTAGVEVVLAVGTSLNEIATDGWSDGLRALRSLIHIDIDASQIGRVYPADIGVCAPATDVLRELVGRVPRAFVTEQHGVATDIDPAAIATGSEGKISAPRFLWELQQVLPKDTIYTLDSGSNLFYATHYLKVDRPDSFVALFGLASMGAGLGLAVGAQLAHPRRTVVAVCGDGGFHMAAAEIATAAAEKLPIIVAVLNDERFGMVEVGHLALFGRTPPFPTGPMDVAGLATASGATSIRIEQPGELLSHGLPARSMDRPLVIDVRIDRTVPIPANRRIDNIKKAVTAKAAN